MRATLDSTNLGRSCPMLGPGRPIVARNQPIFTDLATMLDLFGANISVIFGQARQHLGNFDRSRADVSQIWARGCRHRLNLVWSGPWTRFGSYSIELGPISIVFGPILAAPASSRLRRAFTTSSPRSIAQRLQRSGRAAVCMLQRRRHEAAALRRFVLRRAVAVEPGAHRSRDLLGRMGRSPGPTASGGRWRSPGRGAPRKPRRVAGRPAPCEGDVRFARTRIATRTKWPTHAAVAALPCGTGNTQRALPRLSTSPPSRPCGGSLRRACAAGAAAPIAPEPSPGSFLPALGHAVLQREPEWAVFPRRAGCRHAVSAARSVGGQAPSQP